MKFKKGDLVAFINEPMRGVIVDCIDDHHVIVDCDGLEMDVSCKELIPLTYVPKVDGKYKFPVKKKNRKIDDLPNLEKNTEDYSKLAVGDRVSFMNDQTKGIIVSIINEKEYEVEIENGFTIPAHRLEIEKVILDDFIVDEKGLRTQLKKDLTKEVKKTSKSNPLPASFFEHHELDLHIENLVDTWKGLSNFEIVNIQLSHFRKRLFQAFENNEEFLVVIHGVGKGKLKEEIDKYLDQFPNITVRPADVKLYGMGATELIIN